MINFKKHILSNGLRLLIHEDHTLPVSVLNVIYDVGAKDEDSNKTGFAHLFEHLMFGGSVNIPSYDEPLQRVGGENNAFTSNDITNYYIQIPSINLETAFWLESDRMLNLAFSESSLEVQKNVVVEEFKQRYLNQPYGDAWLKLRPLIYKVHPYQWATIGKEIDHIQGAKIEDVKSFFKKHYTPRNAILVLAGDVNEIEVIEMAEKWFGTIPSGEPYLRNLPREPRQSEARMEIIHAPVPLDALFMAFPIMGKGEEGYYAADLLADLLGKGNSSRLYQGLVKENPIFSEIHAYLSGDIDPGLFVIEGKLIKGKSVEEAKEAIWKELFPLKKVEISSEELIKVKNKMESVLVYSELSLLDKAINLAYFELLGNADRLNEERNNYLKVTELEVMEVAKKILMENHENLLIYHSTI